MKTLPNLNYPGPPVAVGTLWVNFHFQVLVESCQPANQTGA